jgi:hypothetical protein
VLELFTQYYGDKIKEEDMGVVYSTHGKDQKCISNFGCETRRKRSLYDRQFLELFLKKKIWFL